MKLELFLERRNTFCPLTNTFSTLVLVAALVLDEALVLIKGGVLDDGVVIAWDGSLLLDVALLQIFTLG